MNDNRVVKKVAEWTPANTRPKGRPRMRWRDDVVADLRKIGARNWREVVEDRPQWRLLIHQAQDPWRVVAPRECMGVSDSIGCSLPIVYNISCSMDTGDVDLRLSDIYQYPLYFSDSAGTVRALDTSGAVFIPRTDVTIKLGGSPGRDITLTVITTNPLNVEKYVGMLLL
ncbi:hypothetical protein J6590_036990 [Homalodisca vitripennis]|nr:hypothetical protein J6590_036990 [Homalodisca vitripennis]